MLIQVVYRVNFFADTDFQESIFVNLNEIKLQLKMSSFRQARSGLKALSSTKPV